MCLRPGSGGVSVGVQPVFLCRWEELPADLELLSRMALQLGPPGCGLGLINFQEEEGM